MASGASLIDTASCAASNALHLDLGNYACAKPMNRKQLADNNVRLVINVTREDPIVGKEEQVHDRVLANILCAKSIDITNARSRSAL